MPTVHMGVAASAMERCGIRTECGDMNREIAVTNKEIRMLRVRISKLEKWITDEACEPHAADPLRCHYGNPQSAGTVVADTA